MDVAHLALIGGAAFAGGAINAIAGGGSLVTFPVLVACGVPALLASATNTVALCPGYLGATIAQRRVIAAHGAQLSTIVPAAAVGGILGALLLLDTNPRTFDVVVPFLLVFAVALLAFQDRIRALLPKRVMSAALAPVAIGIAAVYGGYFGAGLGVIILAVLAVATGGPLDTLNAMKQAISLAVNVAAAALFVVRGRLDYEIVGVMAIGALAGGFAGAAMASRVSAKLLRAIVVVVGLAVAVVYAVKLLR